VTILPPRACEQYYRGRMRPSMFCAGRDSGGADACQVPGPGSGLRRPVDPLRPGLQSS